MSTPPTKPAASSSQSGTTMVFVGLGLSVLAVVLVNVYAKALLEQSRETTFTAYQFQTPADSGRPLRIDMVKEVQVPVRFEKSLGDLVPKEAIASQADGKTPLVRSAAPGDLLTYNFFKGGKDAESRPDPISSGNLAVAIKVDNPPASLEPGSYIDLRVAVPAGGGRSGMRTIGLMENVRVIAKGETVVSESGAQVKGNMGATKIDIELTPEQAGQIKDIQKAIGGSSFEVMVRNRLDKRPHGTVPIMTEVNPEVFKALGIVAYQANKE